MPLLCAFVHKTKVEQLINRSTFPAPLECECFFFPEGSDIAVKLLSVVWAKLRSVNIYERSSEKFSVRLFDPGNDNVVCLPPNTGLMAGDGSLLWR